MLRDKIIEGAARALWLDAYMAHVGDFADSHRDYPEEKWAEHFCPAALDENATCPTFGTHVEPGPGEDWDDFAPPTGEPARAKARDLIREIEKQNGLENIADPFALIAAEYALGKTAGHTEEPTADLFGHYLAMEALGHGVGWSDSHPDHDLKVPDVEFHWTDL